jgi:hypothetical protein
MFYRRDLTPKNRSLPMNVLVREKADPTKSGGAVYLDDPQPIQGIGPVFE